MATLTLKPTHPVASAGCDSLARFGRPGIEYETAVRSAFYNLLEHCARPFDWMRIPESAILSRAFNGEL